MAGEARKAVVEKMRAALPELDADIAEAQDLIALMRETGQDPKEQEAIVADLRRQVARIRRIVEG